MNGRRPDGPGSEPLTDPEIIKLRDRTIAAVKIALQHLPEKQRERAPKIIAQLDEHFLRYRSEIPRVYALALAQLKAPITNDGIGNITNALEAVNRELKVGNLASQVVVVRFLREWWDQPKYRLLLPGEVSRMVAVMEGRSGP